MPTTSHRAVRRDRRRPGASRMRLGTAAVLAAVLILGGQLAALADAASATASPSTAKITICHRTNAAKNPYVQITVAREAADGLTGNGHGADHFAEHQGPIFDPAIHGNGDDWGDIIPPVDDNGDAMPHNGLNWSSAGQAIWNDGCDLAPPGTPDIVLEKSASAAHVDVDEAFTYTLTARNVSTADATGVRIDDRIPTGLTITGTPAFCTTAGQAVSCQLGTLAGGASRSVTISVLATAGACPSVDNEGIVSASNEDAAATGNDGSNTVTVGVTCPSDRPDVAIRKRSNAPDSGVFPGDRFTYTIVVDNVGSGDADGVTVTDAVPAGLTILSMSSSCTSTGQNVTCQLGTIAEGAHAQVTIDVRATADACPKVTNTARVAAENDSVSSNNVSAPVSDPVNCPEPGVAVRIIKTNDANGDGRYTDNEEAKVERSDVPFKVVIVNTGETSFTIADLTDSFPGDVVDLLSGPCSSLRGATLDAGASIKCLFTMRGYSPASNAGAKVNVARVCVDSTEGPATDCGDDDSRVRSAEVLGRTVTPTPPRKPETRTPPQGLAFTGSEGTVRFGLIAIALMLFGTAAMYSGYRKRQRYEA
jgi:uncharacterized repeat protein (TIGR01451 family)